MREFTFYLPELRDSDKAPQHTHTWIDLEKTLANMFGGFSRRGVVSGVWADKQGNLIDDNSRVYVVAIPDTTEAWQSLESVLIHTRKAFDQQCLYVAETSNNAFLL